MIDPSSAQASDFEGLIGATFVAKRDDENYSLVLQEVTKTGRGLREGGSFSLLFTCASPTLLSQSIYVLEAEKTGKIDLFLVPVGTSQDGYQYESVFT